MSVNRQQMNPEIQIVDYRPELAQHFYTINAQWLTDLFVMETIDEQVLSDPQTHIIDAGGYIWFAEHKDLGIIGACAVKHAGEMGYELTKMGVLSSARGLKVGETLLKQVLKDCSQRQCRPLFLLTNHRCEAAIHLYLKHGFVHDEGIKQHFSGLYDRGDVFMKYQSHIT